MSDKILADCKKAVEEWNLALAKTAVQAAIDAKLEPKDIINEGLGKGMEVIGERFDKAEIYLPQVVAASKAMEVGLQLLAPIMAGGSDSMKGTVIFGTVEGDIHEIGKNVCCAMLRGAGFTVFDLGPDVSPQDFLDSAEENNADIIAGSALMTTTLEVQRDVVVAVKEDGGKYKTMFGGAPCSQEWVDQIGADGYSSNGAEINALAIKLVG
ncbi:MAG: cobalamin B12-binding domain-containing protein [Candidatus Methanomethylophilaceae archaeon]|jgi:trimethylamine corrinoid protein